MYLSAPLNFGDRWYSFIVCHVYSVDGAPVTQWVKHWPTDPTALGSIPSNGGNHFNCKWSSVARSLSNTHPFTSTLQLSDITNTLEE